MASRNSFPLFTHCHLATARGPGDEAHDDGEAAADRTSFPTPDTSGTCALAPAVGAIGGRADGTQAIFVRSASSAEHATASPQTPGHLGAHAPNPSASAGLDELACTGSNNMSAKMASNLNLNLDLNLNVNLNLDLDLNLNLPASKQANKQASKHARHASKQAAKKTCKSLRLSLCLSLCTCQLINNRHIKPIKPNILQQRDTQSDAHILRHVIV